MRCLVRWLLAAGFVVVSCGQSSDSPAVPEAVLDEPTEAPSSTTDATVPTAEETAPLLQRGDAGPWVLRLQQELQRHGYQIEADGHFGPLTEAAVIEFQTAHGLEADGICGPDTWAALMNDGAAPVGVPPSEPSPDPTPETTAVEPMYLRANGLGTFDFGSDAAPLIERLLADLGEPTSDQFDRWGDAACYEQPCVTGQRKTTWHKVGGNTLMVRSVTINDGDVFVGWELDGLEHQDPPFTTDAGIGLGSTVAQVLAAHPNAHFGLLEKDQGSCRDITWSPSAFWIGEPSDTYGTDGLRGFTMWHIFGYGAAVDGALDALGIPRTESCTTKWHCHEAFAKTQELLGVPATGRMDLETWTALGLPLPPDMTATVTRLSAGEPRELYC